MRFVAQSEERFGIMLKTLLKVPVLNLLSALAQHRAVVDEARGLEKKIAGV
jgi:hypothetical protein